MSVVSRQELVGRARALAPRIAERAAKAESLRHVPEETFADYRDAGLLRALVPRAWGGYELPIGTVVETSREIGRVCGSSAWCLAICSLHNKMASKLREAGCREVFGPSPDAVVAGVFMPGGRATPAEGGYRLTGQWDFASGCDHAGHAILTGVVQPEPEKPPTGFASFLVRRQDFRIEDNWFVAGLVGTGSKRLRVDDVFVPVEWTIPLHKGMGGEESATGARADLPTNSFATLGLTGVAIGVAGGAIASFLERMRTKLRSADFRGADRQVGAQLRLAEAAAEVDAAELLVLRDCDEMERTSDEGRTASLEQRARYRRDAAYAFQSCARAVARLLPASGASSIFQEGLLQRALRDTQVMATHAAANWDQSRESYARALLDLPIEDPLL